ncbi:hypothetical protein BHE74_00010530 [Ensete ventricosum]|nr:hypothetical protein BHE74_00010530 [Ensete ventricosum]
MLLFLPYKFTRYVFLFCVLAAELKPVIATLTRLYDETSAALGGPHANPSRKREIEDNSRRIGSLFGKLNSGDMSPDAAAKLVQLCQALDAGDFAGALHIQVGERYGFLEKLSEVKVGWGGARGDSAIAAVSTITLQGREGGRECVSFGPLRIIAIPPLDRLSLSPFLFYSSFLSLSSPPFTTSELKTLIGPLGTARTGSFATVAIGRERNAGACCVGREGKAGVPDLMPLVRLAGSRPRCRRLQPPHRCLSGIDPQRPTPYVVLRGYSDLFFFWLLLPLLLRVSSCSIFV